MLLSHWNTRTSRWHDAMLFWRIGAYVKFTISARDVNISKLTGEQVEEEQQPLFFSFFFALNNRLPRLKNKQCRLSFWKFNWYNRVKLKKESLRWSFSLTIKINNFFMKISFQSSRSITFIQWHQPHVNGMLWRLKYSLIKERLLPVLLCS